MYRFFCFILLILSGYAQFVAAQNPIPKLGPIFKDDVLPRIDIMIDQDSLTQLLLPANQGSDHHYRTTVVFDNGTTRDTLPDVGFRLRGNTSRGAKKKSFKLSMNTYVSGRKYKGLEKMNINGEHNDPSIIRSKIGWDLLRAMGIPAPRANHVQLYVNDRYFGLYINVEHIDEEFVQQRFGNNNGNLYKCTYPATLDFIDYEPDSYKKIIFGKRPYELKTNKEIDDYSDLAQLIDAINNANPPSFACELEAVFNVDSYLKVIAFDILTSNWDGPIFNKNNFYLYKNTATGKFEYIPFDLDNTFGIDWFIGDLASRDIYNWKPANEKRILYTRIMANPIYRKRFSYYMQQLITEFFNKDYLFPYLDAKKALIDTAIINDPYRIQDYGWTPEAYTKSYTTALDGHVKYGLKPYIEERSKSALTQLELENIEPVIRSIQNTVAIPNQPFYWTTTIFDEATVMNVEFCYQVNQEATTTCLQLLDDGQHQDGDSDDGQFGLLVEGFDDNTTLSYYVQVTDAEGLTVRQPLCHPQELQIIGSDLPLYLNEILAKNSSSITDEANELSDWIEIYNAGDRHISLDNMYLTDDVTRPDKWAFPATAVIHAKSFLLIWADEDQEQGELHCNFKLNSKGETISLFTKTEMGFLPIDALTFGEQKADVSYGRVPNGVGEWQAISPSPMASNALVSTATTLYQVPKLRIYPNPATDTFTIVFQEGSAINTVVRLDILNMQGQVVFHDTLSNFPRPQLVWKNDGLPSGTYLIHVYSDKQLIGQEKIVLH